MRALAASATTTRNNRIDVITELIRQRSKLALGIFASRFQLGNISLFLFFFLAIMFLHPLMVSCLAPERKS